MATIACFKDYEIVITAPSFCGAVPSAIGDIVWTITGTNGTTITASMAGGSGVLSCQFTQTSPLPPPYGTDDFTTHNIFLDCQFCNPTAVPIPITFSLPYVSTGGFYGPPAPGAYASIFILVNGVPGVPSPHADFTTDTPNPLVATHSIPAASIVALRLGFFMTGLAVGTLKVATTGPMTLI